MCKDGYIEHSKFPDTLPFFKWKLTKNKQKNEPYPFLQTKKFTDTDYISNCKECIATYYVRMMFHTVCKNAQGQTLKINIISLNSPEHKTKQTFNLIHIYANLLVKHMVY